MSRFKYVSEFVELVDEETGAVTRTVVGRTVPFTGAEEEAADAEEAELALAEADQVIAPITRRQAKIALSRMGLLTAAEAWIAAADIETQIEWADALELRRDHPMWGAAATALGKTEDDIDAMFALAATI